MNSRLIPLILIISIIAGCAQTEHALEPWTGEPVSIIPKPSSMEMTGGSFTITQSTKVIVMGGFHANDTTAHLLADYLGESVTVDRDLSIKVQSEMPEDVILLVLDSSVSNLGDEGYILDVTPERVIIKSSGEAGLFYGAQSFRQLLPSDSQSPVVQNENGFSIPCLSITDSPRFGWRGLMLDCSRTFWTKDEVLRYIDLLAYHKMNVFHLHLTDDNGWRVEIKKYPLLTEIGSKFDARYEGEKSGYYSQDDIREIVAYAGDRHITVVPEIDMPGHFTAALTAYPDLSCTGTKNLHVYPYFKRPEHLAVLTEDILCAGNDKVYAFLEDVFSELIDLFPSEYIHIGGDEAPKARWEKCPKCQAKIKEEGIHDEHELQSYMTSYMADFIESKGRKLIGWDEIIEGGLAENAAVMYWRGWIDGVVEEAVHAGNVVVQSPTSHCYFDYTYDTISTEHAYAYDPVPEGLTPDQERLIIGVQANMWTHIARNQDDLDSQIFPRLAAIAEVGWSPAVLRDWGDFKERLAVHYGRLGAMGVRYFIPPPGGVLGSTVFHEQFEVALDNPVKGGVVRYTTDGSEPTADSKEYSGPFTLYGGAKFAAKTYLPDGSSSGTVRGLFQKKVIKPVVPDMPTQGVKYKYVERKFRAAHEVGDYKATSSGTIERFTIPPDARLDDFGLELTGFIEIKADGVYTFSTVSDDGSRLYIGDTLVVLNDGPHGAIERKGKIELTTGFYSIRLVYFEGGGGQSLKTIIEGPGIERQEVPSSILWHEGGK